MKPNIKHPLLTLLGLSIGFVVTLEAAAGPSVTVPGYSCTSSSGEAFRYNNAGAYEARDRNSRVAVRCSLAHNSEVERFDVDIHINKKSGEDKVLTCDEVIRDGEGNSFDSTRREVTRRGKRTIVYNNRRVPADGYFFVDCRLNNRDQIQFITVEDKS